MHPFQDLHEYVAIPRVAVLMPDPALSTGYGRDFIRRGHGTWGPTMFADLMAITDAAVARDDVDDASLWTLEQMFGTTDDAPYRAREFGDPLTRPERYARNSPDRHAAAIRTPMLVIHGDKDCRVPIGEALRLWRDLTRHEVPAKFLDFPDENHGVLRPGHVIPWYETVLAFLDHHLCGRERRRPELL